MAILDKAGGCVVHAAAGLLALIALLLSPTTSYAEQATRTVWLGRYGFNDHSPESNYYTSNRQDAFRFAQARMEASMRLGYGRCGVPTITFVEEQDRTSGSGALYYGVPVWRIDYIDGSGCGSQNTVTTAGEIVAWVGEFETGPTDERTCKTANPVQPGSGRKRFTETDYSGAGAHPLVVTRHYSSRWTDSAAATGLTPISAWDGGWRHSYQAAITPRSDGGLRAWRPDGAMLSLTPSTTLANTWTATGSRDIVTAIVDAVGARTGYTLTAASDDSTETYDASGKLLNIRARNGWLTTLVYSDATTPSTVAPRAGLLISVKNQFGRELKFSYDAQGRLAELLPPGAIAGQPAGSAISPIRYVYNEPASLGAGTPAQNQLTSVVWQDGSVRRYHHEDGRWPQAVTGITDEAGVRYGTYAYDAQGRVTRSELAGGAATTRSYTFTDIGNVRYPSSLTAPCSLCGSTQQASTYDAAGNPTKQIAHDGIVTFYKYDAKTRETERASFPSSYASASTRPALANATKVISTKWHATWMVPTQIAEPGKLTAYTYNAKGMTTAESWTATTDATGAAKFSAVKTGSTFATGWGYNSNSLMTSWVEKIDATTVAQMNYTVNASANATKATNPITGKSTTSATYDAHGRLVKEVDPYGTITIAYSPRGFVVEEKDETATTTVKHNAIGLATEVNTGTGLIYRWTYSPAQTLTGVSLNDTSLVALGGPAQGRKSFFDLFISTAYAQTAGVPLPGGVPGFRGPGWIGAGVIAWEVGKRLREASQQSSQAEEKKPECDPCDDPKAKLQWTPHGNRHFPPPRVPWDRIIASTSGGGRAYYHPTVVPNHAAQAAFELVAWASGKPSKIRKGYRYKCFPGRVIGASDGAETSCVRIECTSPGVVHGHPVPRTEYTRHTGEP